MQSPYTRLDSRAFGVAAGTIAALISGVCAIAVLIAPGSSKAFFGYLIHTSLADLTVNVTFASFVAGVIGWGLIFGLAFSAAAGLYNRFSGAVQPEARFTTEHSRA